jgi:hypothetical protein
MQRRRQRRDTVAAGQWSKQGGPSSRVPRLAAQSLVRTTSLTSLARWVLYTCILPAAAAAAAAALPWWLY